MKTTPTTIIIVVRREKIYNPNQRILKLWIHPSKKWFKSRELTQHILLDIDRHPFNQHSDYTTNHKCNHKNNKDSRKHTRTHHIRYYTCTFTSGFNNHPTYVCTNCIGETVKLTESEYSVVSSISSHHSLHQLPMRLHQEKKIQIQKI